MNELNDTGAPDIGAVAQRVVFVRRKGLFRLLAKNLLLNIVSLSFYRFWARTALRRFYWSSIAFAGEPLEFAGRGLDLFVGFLIALAILAPLGFAVSTVNQMLDPGSTVQVVANWVYLFVLFVLTLVARYRARRYRLSRTAWRGIRFAVDGSALRYVLLSIGWWLAVVATLGIATPWKRAAQRAYLTRTTTFGDRRFAFAARPSSLLPLWAWTLLLTFGPVAYVVGVNADILLEGIAAFRAGQQQWRIAAPSGVGLLMIVPTFGLALQIFYRVAELRMYTAATTLGDVAFTSAMGGWGILLLTIALFVVAAVIGIAGLYATMQIVAPLIRSGWSIDAAIFAGSFGGFAIWALAVYFLVNGWLRRMVVATYFDSVTVENAAQLDQIGQTARQAPTRGEGLADSFEFGAN